MRRILFVVLAVTALGLAMAPTSALACHWGDATGCTQPSERQPFDPVPFAGVADNVVGQHSDLTVGWEQQAHEQFAARVVLDVSPGFTFDLDAPALDEEIAALTINAISNGLNVTERGEITDNNSAGWPAAGVYRWKFTDHPSVGPAISCDMFVDRNAADRHLHVIFDACPGLVNHAKDVNASVLRVTIATHATMAAGPFITNPSAGGTYTSRAAWTGWDSPDPAIPPTVTKTVDTVIADRVPASVAVSPTSARVAVGQPHTVTAEVRDQRNAPLAGATVDFAVASGAHQGIKCAGVVTGATGRASCTYSEATPGPPDTLRATATKFSTSASGTATVDWDRASALNLAPTSATRTLGQGHAVTATLSDDDGQPMAGETVAFAVTAGPNQGEQGSGVTNAQGQASFAYAGDGGTGTDTIQASAGGLNPTAAVSWVAAGVVLAPESATRTVGQSHTVTATVTDNAGAPMSGVTVAYEVIGGPNQGAAGSGVTDAQGRASFTYTGSGGEGADTIRADAAGGSATVGVTWNPVPALVPSSIGVSHSGGGNTSHFMSDSLDSPPHPRLALPLFVAVVRDQFGSPLPGIEVRFSINDGPNSGALERTTLTGADGSVSLAYNGLRANGEGFDDVLAEVVGTSLESSYLNYRWDTWPCDEEESDATVHEVVHTGIAGFTLPLGQDVNLGGQSAEASACVTE